MNEIERFNELVENSDNIVFFGGAGVEVLMDYISRTMIIRRKRS